ncbi:hypothetical protein Acsp06_32910 [Actinomycetospora sp. NBRC 106375]|uniref:hypothetical protein n=1 Tax=Actinomycetospora sp. NBRC 106375 TaxID=3032207 RepID=UPI0024A0F8C9|nr:hypothetical protein [Actinomycetospora sp. NBRC 106375]GLZ47106.1 hypothetical protein Acsp06_32910 [Actinomycetospora sp. NBRC 106375]
MRRLPAVGVTGVVVAVLLGAGLASAAWLSSGGGTATSRAGQAQAPTTTTVAGSAITANLLYPGSSGDVKVTVNNPNTYPVTVTSVSPNGSPTAAGGSGTCATTGVTLTTASPGTAIPANGSTTLTLAGAASMTSASETGCQNATFTIPVTVAITSA